MKTVWIKTLHEQLNTVPAACALGNFDGVHRAHAALINACKDTGHLPAVFTFEAREKDAIHTESEKSARFEELGIKLLTVAPFALFRELSAEDFVLYLKEKLMVKAVVCGFNFRFGKGAAGNAETLKTLAARHGIDCYVIDEITEGGKTISSSEIRTLLKEGKVTAANTLLGAPYALSGEVLRGYGIGKTLTFPTLNLSPDKPCLLPNGVYITEALIENIPYPAITNIGKNPTFARNSVSYETHLLAATGDFYGKTVTVRFLAFVREEIAFKTPEALKRQVLSDIETARRYHNGGVE